MGVRKLSTSTTNDQVLLELTKTNPHRAHHRQITGFDKEICNESFVVRSDLMGGKIHDSHGKGCHSCIPLQSFHAWAFHVYTYIICIYIYIWMFIRICIRLYNIWYVYSFGSDSLLSSNPIWGHGPSNHWDVECRPNFANWNGNLAAACDLRRWKLMVGRWNFLLGWPIFRGEIAVSFTEGRKSLDSVRWWCFSRGWTPGRKDHGTYSPSERRTPPPPPELLQDLPQLLVK